MQKQVEKSYRSITKTLVWRVLVTGATILIAYVWTRDLSISIGIGGIEVFAKLVLYYVHERVWNRINWGIVYKEDNEESVKQV